jgi:hypothetical protein
MKPCRKYKEQIAVAIVAGDLNGDLRRHVENCAACQAYAEETRKICAEHSRRATALPEAEVPVRLHGRVRSAIAGHETMPCCGMEIRASLRRLLQSLGIAATAAIVIAIWIQRTPPPTDLRPRTAEVKTRGSEITKLSEPTFAAYHHRLARSVEELEASLLAAPVVPGGELLKVSSAINNLP